ncbi:MAG: hypothetical protein ACPHDO_04745 [Candidatus Poseidoniaceae archaeon]
MRVQNRYSTILMILLIIPVTMPNGSASADSVTINEHPSSISADQGIQFSAIVLDSSGNSIDEQINWSTSSGMIDESGFFTPSFVGNVTVTASVGSINSSTYISVTEGWPYAIQTNFTNLDVRIDETVNLNATLIDRGGNPLDFDLVYRCQNGEIDFANKTWTPDKVGNATLRIMYQEIEEQVIFNVQPGNATQLQIPIGLTVQSGSSIHINISAIDTYGNEVKLSEVGKLTFEVENGSISNTGLYFATAPGLWNISVNNSFGAIGYGKIRVLPAQATGLDIEIGSSEIRAGSAVNLSAIRTDIFGNSGEIDLPLSNWTTPSGTLAKVGQSVQWTPSEIGNWIIGVSDQGYSATLSVSVSQGFANNIDILFSEPIFKSGELIIASLSVFDAAGNSKPIDGAWEISSTINFVDHGTWQELRPGPIGSYSVSANWFDNETQQVFEIQKDMEIISGELARIVLPESGTQVASDEVLIMKPIFEDEYGNEITGVLVEWTIEQQDMTMQIRLAGDKWAPEKLGIHEIRATSQGIFAITEVEVIPGVARQIFSNYNETINIESGKTVEIEIFTLDVNGNQALADEVSFDFDDPAGTVSTSSTGIGYWHIKGGIEGSWNLRISSGTATDDITVNVSYGEPVRLIAELPPETPDEGDEIILRIYALDQAGNIVPVPDSEVTIQCTSGSATHVSGDTYILKIDQAGQSQSCNIYWNDLVAQRFFDVGAVLFGGGLGSTNTALTMVSVIVILFIAIMMILVKRIRPQQQKENYWDDEEYFEETDELAEVEGEIVETKPSLRLSLLQTRSDFSNHINN